MDTFAEQMVFMGLAVWLAVYSSVACFWLYFRHLRMAFISQRWPSLVLINNFMLFICVVSNMLPLTSYNYCPARRWITSQVFLIIMPPYAFRAVALVSSYYYQEYSEKASQTPESTRLNRRIRICRRLHQPSVIFGTWLCLGILSMAGYGVIFGSDPAARLSDATERNKDVTQSCLSGTDDIYIVSTGALAIVAYLVALGMVWRVRDNYHLQQETIMVILLVIVTMVGHFIIASSVSYPLATNFYLLAFGILYSCISMVYPVSYALYKTYRGGDQMFEFYSDITRIRDTYSDPAFDPTLPDADAIAYTGTIEADTDKSVPIPVDTVVLTVEPLSDAKPRVAKRVPFPLSTLFSFSKKPAMYGITDPLEMESTSASDTASDTAMAVDMDDVVTHATVSKPAASPTSINPDDKPPKPSSSIGLRLLPYTHVVSIYRIAGHRMKCGGTTQDRVQVPIKTLLSSRLLRYTLEDPHLTKLFRSYCVKSLVIESYLFLVASYDLQDQMHLQMEGSPTSQSDWWNRLPVSSRTGYSWWAATRRLIDLHIDPGGEYAINIEGCHRSHILRHQAELRVWIDRTSTRQQTTLERTNGLAVLPLSSSQQTLPPPPPPYPWCDYTYVRELWTVTSTHIEQLLIQEVFPTWLRMTTNQVRQHLYIYECTHRAMASS